ncbi:MAG: sel1 repeat family protein, partial [Proteobacteria bacterium]|nr:sel1 repeat family protein [Pseudomonadota bacterium]
MGRLALAAALVLLLTADARADLGAGISAYKRGDYATALAEFRRAAEQGSVVAQINLAAMYYKGQGVPQDDAEAATWYRKAADQGDAVAQNNIGLMYDNGRGVPQDYGAAVKWYRRAA